MGHQSKRADKCQQPRGTFSSCSLWSDEDTEDIFEDAARCVLLSQQIIGYVSGKGHSTPLISCHVT